MVSATTIQSRVASSPSIRRWASRAFIVSILLYLVVLGYLLSESVRGASRWAPYGVNMPVFVALIIGSEVIVTASAVWIFREDSGIWPASVSDGWRALRKGHLGGLGQMLTGAWDVSIIDLRLRTPAAIALGRINRLAALAPLAYALVASANGGTPWGLRASAIFDVVITLGVWAFMEAVMVRPTASAPDHEAGVSASATTVVAAISSPSLERKESRYEIRRLSARDIPRVEAIEQIRWREQAATRDQIQGRLSRFPQGQLAAVHVSMRDGQASTRTVVAWCTVMAAREEAVRSFGSWDEVTAHGTIANCDPGGDVVVGVNLTSVTEGATYILLGEILASVVEWGKTKMIGGARLNGFASFNEQRTRAGKRAFTADEYARLREIRGYHVHEQRIDNGEPPLSDAAHLDLVNGLRTLNNETALDASDAPDYVCSNLRGYLSIPGAHLVSVAPNYFPDVSSDNWGVVIDWTTPLPRAIRHIPFVKRFAARRIRKEVLSEWEARKRNLRDKAQRRATEARAPVAEPALP